ncbi:hypothetical protein ABZ805_27605 [Saccharopolyspora sp. NPDC047091]|uniref:hypothetical protein n=1 Tax=Saccharopolyspora sp. NPDC047091 TaxID=3155924 RepID=UPI003403C036
MITPRIVEFSWSDDRSATVVKCSGSSCQYAINWECRCNCAHANHGAKGRLGWAAALATPPTDRTSQQQALASTAKNRQQKADTAQRDRVQHHVGKSSPTRSAGNLNWTDTKTAIEFARTRDIVDRLVRNDIERTQLIHVVDEISRIAGELLDSLGHGRDVRLRIGDHFWCDVVAGVVSVLARSEKTSGEIDSCADGELAAQTWDSLIRSRTSSHGYRPIATEGTRPTRAELDERAGLLGEQCLPVLQETTAEIVEIALEWLTGGTDPLLLKLRMLAVLSCPDPARHKLVWDSSLVPLLTGPITSALQQRLTTLLRGLVEPLSWDE